MELRAEDWGPHTAPARHRQRSHRADRDYVASRSGQTYIGVVAYDAEPNRVVGTQMVRDGSLNADDRIEILLDTFRDQRSAFYFATNAAGALVDGLAFANGQLNTEWDAIWHVRTTRTSSGWTAEFAIPFKSLSFPADQNVWGFNIARTISAQTRGRSLVGRPPRHAVSSGTGSGRDYEPRRAHAGHRPRSAPVPRRKMAAPGRDRRRRLQREAGTGYLLQHHAEPQAYQRRSTRTSARRKSTRARRINLTRFSLLFPEKRAFFLEGAGVFSFASTGPETPGGIPGTGADV